MLEIGMKTKESRTSGEETGTFNFKTALLGRFYDCKQCLIKILILNVKVTVGTKV